MYMLWGQLHVRCRSQTAACQVPDSAYAPAYAAGPDSRCPAATASTVDGGSSPAPAPARRPKGYLCGGSHRRAGRWCHAQVSVGIRSDPCQLRCGERVAIKPLLPHSLSAASQERDRDRHQHNVQPDQATTQMLSMH